MARQRFLPDLRRQHILEATWRLIAKRGLDAVRVADIARACGTSTGTVHYYFPTKDDVLIRSLEYCAERALLREGAELRKVTSTKERLYRLLDMQVPCPGDPRDEWSIWLQFWVQATLRPKLRSHNELYARWRESLANVIHEGQTEGVFRKLDVAEATLQLSALIDGMTMFVMTGTFSPNRMRGFLRSYVEEVLLVSKARSRPKRRNSSRKFHTPHNKTLRNSSRH